MSTFLTLTFLGFNKNVTKVKKDGGTYVTNVILLHDGKYSKDKTINDIGLRKNPLLANTLEGLAPNSLVEIELDDTQYKNLVMIKPVGGEINVPSAQTPPAVRAETTKTTIPEAKPKRDDYGVGMAVGNALNNAVLLLTHGIVKGGIDDVRSLAARILQEADTLKEAYMNRDTDKFILPKHTTGTGDFVVDISEEEF